MHRYPVAAEHVAYNIRDGQIPEASNLSRMGLRYVSSEKSVTPVAYAESAAVHELTHKCVVRFMLARHIPNLSYIKTSVWSIDSIGDPIGDRTVPVVFSDHELVTEELIRYLQSEVLESFGLWRLRHVEEAERPDLALVIYPDMASIGQRQPTIDIDSVACEWRTAISHFRENSQGPTRRQLLFVERSLSGRSLRFLRSMAPSFIGTFDNAEGDRSMYSLWFVVRGDTSYACEIECNDIEEGYSYPICRDGLLGSREAVSSPSGLWIREMRLPVVPSVQVTLKARGESRVVEFQKVDIIRDDDLHRADGL